MHILFHFAYLDPGTGSLIIQSVIGAIAGVIVFGRRQLMKIRAKLFHRGKSEDNSTPQSSAKNDKPKDGDNATK